MSTTASYRHLIVNKENPSSAAAAAACQENATPGLPSMVLKRRALGDVMNTAISNRPVGLTPAKSGAKFASAATNTPKQAPRCTVESALKMAASETAAELPAVERFVPAPLDTFDDLFEDNLRLTDIFLSAPHASIKFVGRLPSAKPSASSAAADTIRLDEYEIETDKEARRQLKRRNKTLKKRSEAASADELSIFAAEVKDLSPVRELELNDSDLEKL